MTLARQPEQDEDDAELDPRRAEEALERVIVIAGRQVGEHERRREQHRHSRIERDRRVSPVEWRARREVARAHAEDECVEADGELRLHEAVERRDDNPLRDEHQRECDRRERPRPRPGEQHEQEREEQVELPFERQRPEHAVHRRDVFLDRVVHHGEMQQEFQAPRQAQVQVRGGERHQQRQASVVRGVDAQDPLAQEGSIERAEALPARGAVLGFVPRMPDPLLPCQEESRQDEEDVQAEPSEREPRREIRAHSRDVESDRFGAAGEPCVIEENPERRQRTHARQRVEVRERGARVRHCPCFRAPRTADARG